MNNSTKSKFHLVKEIKETTSIDEVNSLVADGWIVMDAVQRDSVSRSVLFALGRIK